MIYTLTPYFVIHESLLEKNIHDFQSALAAYWPNAQLCYSVKTNSLPWLLSYMDSRNIFPEVVSDEEYALADALGVTGEHIVFNGPIKGEQIFKQALKAGAVINLDAKKDVELLSRFSADVNPERIGIRVNLPCTIFEQTDIDYAEDGFRFGFSAETGEFQAVVERIHSLFPNARFGLHLHVNSITRSPNVYRAVARYAARLIQNYRLNVSFIDIGGGFFGGVENKPTPDEYIKIIRDALSDTVDCKKVTLYVEPGSAIIASSADLITTVLDTKETSTARIVTTDGSRIHIDPLWKKSRYTYTLSPTDTESKLCPKKQIICGYTCMDHDRIMTLEDERPLQIGDQIVYRRVGAYTMTFGGAFIRYLPDVYVEQNEKYLQIRDKMSVNEYISMHSKKSADR